MMPRGLDWNEDRRSICDPERLTSLWYLEYQARWH